MDLSERIKTARKNAGFKSREALADFLGSTRNAINEYEQGRVIPNDVFLQLMATKLHISYDWLKYGKGEMEDTAENYLTELLENESLTELDKKIMEIYIALSPEKRQMLIDFANKIVETQNQLKKEEPEINNLTDEEKELVRNFRASKN